MVLSTPREGTTNCCRPGEPPPVSPNPLFINAQNLLCDMMAAATLDGFDRRRSLGLPQRLHLFSVHATGLRSRGSGAASRKSDKAERHHGLRLKSQQHSWQRASAAQATLLRGGTRAILYFGAIGPDNRHVGIIPAWSGKIRPRPRSGRRRQGLAPRHESKPFVSRYSARGYRVFRPKCNGAVAPNRNTWLVRGKQGARC